MQGQKEGSGRNVTARMRNLSNGSKGVFYRDFERVLKEMGNITVSELKEVATFATDQFGFWEAEWLFSAVHCPNIGAQAEVDAWKPLCRVFTETLMKKDPTVGRLFKRQQDLTLLRHSLERRVKYNRTRPLERLCALALGKTSIALSKLGLKDTARKLYSYSLYPKGTVGRTSL